MLRWHHPQRGLVAPAEFPAVAEDAGLMQPITERAFSCACADFARWRQSLGAQAPAVLSFKVSTQQLQRAEFADLVQGLLAQHRLQPASLRLEWSEADAAPGDAALPTLQRLRGLGLGLTLTDFGIGRASLARLQQVPIDMVKIDQSLVWQAGSVEPQRVLVEAIARVAASMGICTVAQGVETQAQAALMRKLHCDAGQGSLYGAALTAQALQDWLRSRLALAA